MPFKQGRQKTGGRELGTENKITKEVKAMIVDMTNKLYQDVINNINELDTNQKASLLMKLIEYRVPKLRSVDVDMTGNNSISIEPKEWVK